jgi:hypothetical protein
MTALVLLGLVAAPFSSADEPEEAAAQTPTPSSLAVAPSPTATPSSEPTAEPSVRATSQPSSTPEATPEPSPTPEPTPSREPTPDPTPGLDFETIKKSGRGDKLLRFRIPEGSVALAKFTHSGSGNFAVWTVDSSGQETDLLVNEIGKYQGRVMFDETSHSVAFSITASGGWTATISPIQKIPKWNGTEARKGSSDDVFMLTGDAAEAFGLKLRHRGDGNFAVWAYGSDSTDLLVNEIGAYSGEVLLGGAQILELTADGPWSTSLLE